VTATSHDFGDVPFTESAIAEFFIENKGKVAFQYAINLETLSRPGVVEVYPREGRVHPQEKATKINVKIYPGAPGEIQEYFMVEIAHFKPQKFSVNCKGTYPGIVLRLPRILGDKKLSTPENLINTELHNLLEKAGISSQVSGHKLEFTSRINLTATATDLGTEISKDDARKMEKKFKELNKKAENFFLLNEGDDIRRIISQMLVSEYKELGTHNTNEVLAKGFRIVK